LLVLLLNLSFVEREKTCYIEILITSIESSVLDHLKGSIGKEEDARRKKLYKIFFSNFVAFYVSLIDNKTCALSNHHISGLKLF
jgi:hypothetical protein